MMSLLPWNLPDDIQCALIAHVYAPKGSVERIFAQNYLFIHGFQQLIERNKNNNAAIRKEVSHDSCRTHS